MVEVKDRTACCGCSACRAICPHDAISMRPDALGFTYPHVDMDLCVKCGLCVQVCDFSGRKKTSPGADPVEVHAVRHKSTEVVAASQSGGVFTALTDIVLKDGGVVYGAAFDDSFSVCHRRESDASGRDTLRGSKYVQSDLRNTFREVLDDLCSGLTVLFSGTPCQCAGLDSFIPERYRASLILVDFVCHGVPSPAVWQAYLAEKRRKGSLHSVNFRDKSQGGWKIHMESFLYEDGRKDVCKTFRTLFYKNIMLRPSCGSCTYDIFNRCSDIVISDFWGVGSVLPQFDGDAGTSMVIPLTDKGHRLLGEASSDLDTATVCLSRNQMREMNPNLLSATRMHPECRKFEDAFASRGLRYVASRWGDRGWRYKVWQIKCILRKLRS